MYRKTFYSSVFPPSFNVFCSASLTHKVSIPCSRYQVLTALGEGGHSNGSSPHLNLEVAAAAAAAAAAPAAAAAHTHRSTHGSRKGHRQRQLPGFPARNEGVKMAAPTTSTPSMLAACCRHLWYLGLSVRWNARLWLTFCA